MSAAILRSACQRIQIKRAPGTRFPVDSAALFTVAG